MRRSFILFVLVHVMMDLAIPSAGAFRFNPDESVVALRVQPIHGQDLASAPPAEPFRFSIELQRLALQVPLDLRRNVSPLDLISLLPRRDPSSDGSPRSLSEDA